MDMSTPEEPLYHQECCFCGQTHAARYADEVFDMVMACRDQAPLRARGTLDVWGEEVAHSVLIDPRLGTYPG